MVAAVYDWTGFYIGANGGWGSSRNSWIWSATAPRVRMTRPAVRSVARSAIAGRPARSCSSRSPGQLGRLLGQQCEPGGPAFPQPHQRRCVRPVHGQVGYAVNNVLLYVKGGAAVTSNTYRVNTVGGALAGVTGDDTRWGGTIGAGLEYAFAPNWSVGVEYNHLFCRIVPTTSRPRPARHRADRIRQDVDLVTARLNYRFGGPRSRDTDRSRTSHDNEAPERCFRGFLLLRSIGRSMCRSSPTGKA